MQSTRWLHHAFRNIFDRSRIANKRACRLSLSEKTLFVERLSYLLGAHQPLDESIRMIRRQSGARMNVFLERILSDVEGGKRLHSAVARASCSFSPFALTMIRVGQECGILDSSLSSLAHDFKKKSALRVAVANALLYPALVALAIGTVVILLTFYLFPKILPIIQSLHLDLPLTTRLLIDGYAFWNSNYWIIGIASAVLFAGALTAFRREEVRSACDALSLRLPCIRSLVQNYQSAIVCRSLGLLLANDVRISDALDICSESTRNLVYRKALLSMKKQVLCGDAFSDLLERVPQLFPVLVPQMVSVGEKSGSLSTILLSLAEQFENRMETHAQQFAHTLEPALMLILGLVIGFIATAIITPFYAITQQLQRF